jgi:hypothetical protein
MSHTTRRDFAKLALAALPAAGLFSVLNRAQAAEVAKGARPKPNSKVNGVQIGLNVPYSFGGRTMPADEIISNCVLLGVNALELRTQPVEAFLGSPVSDVVAARGSAINANEAKANALSSKPGVSASRWIASKPSASNSTPPACSSKS